MGETSFKIMLLIFNLIFIAFISAIIIFIREYKIKKRAHVKELENKDFVHKKELLETQVEIQNQTMKYIGKEIHDNIGQKLTLSSLYLQQLVFENKASHIDDKINNINNIITESLDDLRHLSRSLTDDTIEKYSIVKLIEQECKKINQLKKCDIIFNSSLKININSYQIKTILLRITQEFIQNSLKHSQCKKIDILISNTENELQLFLKDDGVGFDVNTAKDNGIGLNNIKKRIEMLDGMFKLQSDINGTAITLKILI